MVDRSNPELRQLAARFPAESDITSGLALARHLEKEWRISIDRSLAGATNCLVLAGLDSLGREVVLRVPLCDEEMGSGFHAQIAFSDHGGIEVLASDPKSGTTLLPFLDPGTPLHQSNLDEQGQVAVTCSIIRRFPKNLISEAVPVEKWYKTLFQLTSAEAIPDNLLKYSQRLAETLLSSASPVLLHGDLHHYNILQNGDDWIAIDPKGVVGDLALEPAAFLRNPYPTLKPTPSLMAGRIRGFAQGLGLSAERIKSWAVAQNVLSAVWDEPNDRTRTVAVVEAIRAANV